jgi:hypothetical protein
MVSHPWCRKATRATAPTGGRRPVKLPASRPCPVSRCRGAGADQYRPLCGVIEVTLATATSALESRFDPFLYAAVRDDPDGAPLTVLSVLARLDVDPWEEAARLAQLPAEAGVAALAGWLSASPKGSAAPPDGGKIAARLITLLPRRPERGITARTAPSAGPRMIRIPNRTTIITRAILFLIVLALLLASQWAAVSQLASRPAKKATAAPARAVPAPPTRPALAAFRD